MKIIDLDEHNKPVYFHCLEPWSDEMKESGTHKASWFEAMKSKGLRVKIAVDDGNNAVGMIQYIPIEHSHVSGENLYFIYCIWVHGHKQGIGNHQHKGIGSLLLEAAEHDALSLGAKGMAAWGLSLPFWMKASWFKKHGYRKADKTGMLALMWKPFSGDAAAPKWVKQSAKPDAVKGKVAVTSFINGWCPAQNIAHERAKRASGEFGDKVVFNAVHTSDEETFKKWGISDGLFIDDTQISTGPAPSYEKIKKLIAKRVGRLK